MTKRSLAQLQDAELVELFAQCCVQQDIGLLGNGVSYFNRYYERLEAVAQELKRREDDNRTALLVLFNRHNMQVRLKAAKHTLAFDRVNARRQLEEIAASKWYPQAGDAGMSLSYLDDGTHRPF